jgi:hypothetical protein
MRLSIETAVLLIGIAMIAAVLFAMFRGLLKRKQKALILAAASDLAHSEIVEGLLPVGSLTVVSSERSRHKLN